jgi:hypothetical protein
MKQTAVEYLEEQLFLNHEPTLNQRMVIKEAKEMEKQQQGYNEKVVELVALEMVTWSIDKIGNISTQSGKKFDEVLSKYKNK